MKSQDQSRLAFVALALCRSPPHWRDTIRIVEEETARWHGIDTQYDAGAEYYEALAALKQELEGCDPKDHEDLRRIAQRLHCRERPTSFAGRALLGQDVLYWIARLNSMPKKT